MVMDTGSRRMMAVGRKRLLCQQVRKIWSLRSMASVPSTWFPGHTFVNTFRRTTYGRSLPLGPSWSPLTGVLAALDRVSGDKYV